MNMSRIPSSAYWHSLNIIGLPDFWKLKAISEKLGGVEALWESGYSELLKCGTPQSLLNKIIPGRNRINPAREWEKLSKYNLEILSIDQAQYPKALGEIPSPPPIIYARGDLSVLDKPGLAVIGSRKLSPYGQQAVDKIIPPLVSLGVTITSGMAIGADSAALNCALEHSGKVVGVLASSIIDEDITPVSERHLAKKIIQNGCLISEFPPGHQVHKAHFPQRNRIVSGLSLGVLVIEAAMKSGSLITARLGLEQNREIFAVPGSIFSQNSAGTIDLIKRGAKCVSNAHDIAYEFGWDLEPIQKQMKFNNPLHQMICDLLNKENLSQTELIIKTGKDAGEIFAALTELELSGTIKPAGNGNYVKII